METQVSPAQAPYRLDPDQTLKASQALLRHVQAETRRLKTLSSKKSLLDDQDEGEGDDSGDDVVPIWLNLTTKQHVVDKNRLKPSKISVPNPLNTASDLTICLITSDPQRAVKDLIADPSFPTELASRITRIIGFTKLKDRYKSFEQRRALLSEHDMFLADDRIITRLPATLGKVFYKGTSKRPIPVRLAEQQRDGNGNTVPNSPKRRSKEQGSKPVGSPALVAKEIRKALSAVSVNLRPGTMVATRVGNASFTPTQLTENIVAVVDGLIEKHVVKGWRNVKAIHIKSPTSFAIPIWLTDDLWVEESNVEAALLEDTHEEDIQEKKRKRNPTSSTGPQSGTRKKRRSNDEENSLQKLLGDDKNDSRKDKLAKQKAQAFKVDGLLA